VSDQLTIGGGGGIVFLNQFNLNSNRGIRLNGTATIDTNGFNTTFGGVISGLIIPAGSPGLSKNGLGTLTLTGNNQYFGATTVNRGAIEVNGGVITGASANASLTIGTLFGNNGILVINNGGVVNALSSSAPSVRMGGLNAAGAIYVNSGTLTAFGNGAQGEFYLGQTESGYGALMVGASGNVSIGNWMGLGRLGGQGYLSMDGGSLFLTGGNLGIGSDYAVGDNVNVPHGVADFTNGAVANINGNMLVGAQQTGYAAIRNNAIVNNTGNTQIMAENRTTAQQGYLSLVNGGTLVTNQVVVTPSTNSAHTALLNFNGGILKARAGNANFINFTNTGQTAFSAIIYQGGATIDDGGNAITVAANFISASGNGVDPTGLSFNGSGFIAPPLVQINGGGGVGATAIANLDAFGNITGVTMTNPGTGYVNATDVSFTFVGGGVGATASAIGTATLVANGGTGAFNKNGLGTLTQRNRPHLCRSEQFQSGRHDC